MIAPRWIYCVWFGLFLGLFALPQKSLADDVPPGGANFFDAYLQMEGNTLAWIKRTRGIARRYKAAHEKDYLAHWESVLTQNIATIKKYRDKDSERFQRAFHRYMQKYTPDKQKLMHYLAATVEIQSFIDTPTASVKTLDRQYKLPEGHSAISFHELIAETSRPDPFKLEDVELVIVMQEPAKDVDYWPDRTPSLDLSLSNRGPEDAEGVTFTLTLSAAVNEDLSGQGISCDNKRPTKTASCRKDTLAEGEEVPMSLRFDLARKHMRFPREKDHRTTVMLDASAVSADPAYQTSKSISFTVRDCKGAYAYRLRKARDLKLRKYQRAVQDVLAVTDALPGRTFYPAPESTASQMIRKKRGIPPNTELQALGREVASNKGPDGFLRRMSDSGSRLGLLRRAVENLADNLMSETRSSRVCASPKGHLARLRDGLWPIRTRMIEVSNMASVAQAEARGRLDRYKGRVAKTGSPDPNETALKSAGKGLASKSSRMWANFAVKDLMDHLKFAESSMLRTAGKAVGAIGLAKSTLDILVASDDLAKLSISAAELEPLLGWMELSTYLTALEIRYRTLIEAHDAYFKVIEEAYEEACTCREPF